MVKNSQRKHGDAIYKRETFHFSMKCPLLCFLEFPSNGNVVGCFQWSFQVSRMCGGIEAHFLPLGMCPHVTLLSEAKIDEKPSIPFQQQLSSENKVWSNIYLIFSWQMIQGWARPELRFLLLFLHFRRVIQTAPTQITAPIADDKATITKNPSSHFLALFICIYSRRLMFSRATAIYRLAIDTCIWKWRRRWQGKP